MVEKASDDNLVKRIDALTLLLDFIQKRLGKLEDESDQTRSTLTQLQITIGSLDEYLQRQRKLEETIQTLTTQLATREAKVENLNESQKKIEGLLWGLIIAMVPGILGAIWELSKVLFGIK